MNTVPQCEARHDPELDRFDWDGSEEEFEGPSKRRSAGWQDYFASGTAVYRCSVRLVQEEEHLFSVYVPSLPGTASQGETEAESLRNIKEALVGAIQVHKESGTAIPWSAVVGPTDSSEIERWITVHV